MSAEQQEAVHRVYGTVRIVEQRNHGIELRIRSDEGHLQWVRRHELLRPPTASPPAVTRQQSTRTQARSERESRTIIEALRYGINPGQAIEQFTFGRDSEIAAVKEWLATDSRDATRIVLGAYGQGKSHFLSYLYQLALEQSYAVALVEVDEEKAPFGKPKRLYQQVMRSLRYLEPETGERDGARGLIARILDAGIADSHPYFRHLRRRQDDTLWSWLLAESMAARPFGEPVPSLPDYSVAANLYSYLLTSLSYLCSRPQVGLRGLLLLFDECEALSTAPSARQTSYVGQKGLEAAINLIKAAEHHPRETWRRSVDAQTYTSYGYVPELYPPAFVEQQHRMKLVLAFPEYPHHLQGFPLYENKLISLNALTRDHLTSIFTAALQHYNRAYNYSTPSPRFSEMFSLVSDEFKLLPSLRLQIKMLIEALDILRHHPDRSPQELFSD